MVTLTFSHSDGHTAASLAPLKCKHWAVSYANNLKVEAGGWERPRGGQRRTDGGHWGRTDEGPGRIGGGRIGQLWSFIYYLLSLIF